MEDKKNISEKINTLIVKNTDLHHLYLSLAQAADGDILVGKLKSHADKHRLMNLELVGEIKAFYPEAKIDLDGSFGGGLAKGWEEIKKSFNMESDEDIKETFKNSHLEASTLYTKQIENLRSSFLPLQKKLEEQKSWFEGVTF